MGLLDGKKALVFGVANDHSIAWGIARAFHEQGATLGFSSVESLIERRVRPLAESIGSTFVEPCDVQDDAQIAAVFDRWRDQHGGLDILVHALAFAKREDLEGGFIETSRDGFALALDVSAYSLVALARGARPLLRPGGSILTLTYYGSEKVVANYNVMGVAKAALEASVRYLAADLGPDGIRVNAISAGPVRTLAAAGIGGFKKMYGSFAEVAPLRENITPEDVGGTAVWLASDLGARGDRRGRLRRRRVQHRRRAARRHTAARGQAGSAAHVLVRDAVREVLDVARSGRATGQLLRPRRRPHRGRPPARGRSRSRAPGSPGPSRTTPTPGRRRDRR